MNHNIVILTTPEVARVVGLPLATVESWAKIGYLPPSVQQAHRQGERNLFSERDALTMKVVKAFRRRMQDLSVLQPVVDFLRTDERVDLDQLKNHSMLGVVFHDGIVGGGTLFTYPEGSRDLECWFDPKNHIQFGEGKDAPYVSLTLPAGGAYEALVKHDISHLSIDWVPICVLLYEVRDEIAKLQAEREEGIRQKPGGGKNGKSNDEAGGRRQASRPVPTTRAPARRGE